MIKVQTLSKDINDHFIIKVVDFQLHAGEFVCILGPSGCGKTTLLEIMSGLQPASRGQVLLQSCNLGFVFQSPSLIAHLTALKNIEFPLRIKPDYDDQAAQEKAESLMERVGILNCRDKLPHMLSGGETQRVELCRALITEPEILFMDEPFRSLDEFTRNKLNDLLISVWRAFKPLIVFVTHSREEVVFLGEKIYIMNNQPSEIIEEIINPMAYPRDRGSDEFHGMLQKIIRITEEI